MIEGTLFNFDDEIAYLDLKQQLIRLFGQQKKQQCQIIQEFNNRVQTKNENAFAYSLALKNLANKAFPNYPDVTSAVKNQFINGIYDKNIRVKILSEEHGSLDETIQRAMKLEEVYRVERDKDALNSPGNFDNQRIYTTQGVQQYNSQQQPHQLQASYQNQAQPRQYQPNRDRIQNNAQNNNNNPTVNNMNNKV